MEKKRKTKIISIIALVIAIVGMSLGFAAFSTTLDITSSANVKPNSADFSVKFSAEKDSLVVTPIAPSLNPNNLVGPRAMINNDGMPILKNINVAFKNPGDYIEYTVYARNEGLYTAYLNNINFLGEVACVADRDTSSSLTAQACDAMSISVEIGGVTYNETTAMSNHALAVNTGEEIKIRLEYAADGAYVDGRVNVFFPDIALTYATVNSSSFSPDLIQVVSGDIDTIGSEVKIGSEYFYVYGHEGNDVKLLSKYNLYVGGTYDWTKNVWIPYTNEATGIQSSSMKGITESAGKPHYGVTAFSSSVGTYLDNYESYLSNYGASISDVRLISTAELEDLGCSMSEGKCTNAPEFVVSSTYWTGDYVAGSNDQIYAVRPNNVLVAQYYEIVDNESCGNGVRPVVIMQKSQF